MRLHFLKRCVWLILSLSLALAFILVVRAAPLPLRLVINHAARQCAWIVPGDECGGIALPPDWQYLDPAEDQQCPSGYAVIELHPQWVPFKARHCCIEGHSGMNGDCQDVIIHQRQRKCAFVEDIQRCPSLPDGWVAWGQNCPHEFDWAEDIVCSLPEAGIVATATGVQSTQTLFPLSQSEPPLPTQPTPSPSLPNRDFPLPCLSFGLPLLFLLWVRFRGI